MIVFTDTKSNFQWLPQSWGITSDSTGGEKISTITELGLDSGIYDNLTTDMLSDWGVSYHSHFTQLANNIIWFNSDSQLI